MGCRVVRPRQRVVDVERGPGGTERVVVVRPRRAEQRHDGVPDVLVDRAAVADDDTVDERREAGDELAHLLRVKLLRQRREAGDVGEQHGDLAALAGLRADGLARRLRGRGLCGGRAALGDCRQQPLAVAERGDAELFQIGVGQLGEHAEIDVVVGKALRILGQAEPFEPAGNLLHGGSLHSRSPAGQVTARRQAEATAYPVGKGRDNRVVIITLPLTAPLPTSF